MLHLTVRAEFSFRFQSPLHIHACIRILCCDIRQASYLFSCKAFLRNQDISHREGDPTKKIRTLYSSHSYRKMICFFLFLQLSDRSIQSICHLSFLRSVLLSCIRDNSHTHRSFRIFLYPVAFAQSVALSILSNTAVLPSIYPITSLHLSSQVISSDAIPR